MAGTWEADSYQLIREKKAYKEDTLSLNLYENMTFEGRNFPDFINDEAKHRKLVNVSGKWNVEKLNNRCYLMLRFSAGELFKNSTLLEYSLYMKDSQLGMMCFIGDPDLGERLLFIKK